MRLFVGLLVSVLLASVPESEAASVQLAWDPSPDASVTAYRIHYGVAPRSYTNQVAFGNVSTGIVEGLKGGVTYYFAATAVSDEGLESEFSNEVPHLVPAHAVISFARLHQTYTGGPMQPDVTVSPSGVNVALTYDGTTNPPTEAGSYALVATSLDPFVPGSAAETFVIAPATATVTLTDLARTYDGTAQAVAATTSPTGLPTVITYDGSMTPPVLAGSYTVVATVASRNFVGSATDTLVISAPAPNPSPATSPVLVDNADASGITFVGAWSTSTTTPDYWATNYHHDGNAGKGSKSAIFKPTLPNQGSYEVFIRHPSRSDYAANVPVDVVHAGGTNTVTLNLRLQGGTWKSLGIHSFNAGASGYVRIRTSGTTGYVVADAVMFVASELIVDDGDPTGVTYVGSWPASTTTPRYWGDCYRHDENKNKGSKSVTFTPSLGTPGTYQVFIRHPARSDYPANVPVDILHAGGIATVAVNQRLDGGVWKPLGTFDFQAGTAGSVRIRTTGTSGYVAADAVKWVLVTPSPTPTVARVAASRPNHPPTLLISRDPSGYLTLEWETVAGVGYALESAADPAATWKQLLETTGDGSSQSFQVAPEARQALFRVRITGNPGEPLQP